MTVQEDIAPKVVVSGPLVVGDIIPLDFGYINKEDIKVDVDGNLLTYNVDYEVTLQNVEIKTDIDSGVITAYRSTPLNQEAEFPQNNKFNSAKLNESLDKICMQQQEQEERINRSICLPIGLLGNFNFQIPTPIPKRGLRVKDDGSGFEYTAYDPNDLSEEIQKAEEYAKQAKNWANKTTDTVDGQEYSAKYYAQKSEDQADRAGAYADRAQFGLKWIEINDENRAHPWVLDESEEYYECTLVESPIIVAIYKGIWFNKQLVVGVDIRSTEDGTVIRSTDDFHGYVLVADSILSNYEHTQDIASDTWIINHNLGYIPDIIVVDENNEEPICGRHHDSLNKCTITFTTPQTGKAYLRY